MSDQGYEHVLKTKLAVCEGYANTLKKFLDDCNLEERLGDVKGALSFSYKCAAGNRLDFVVRDLNGKEIRNAVMQTEKDGKTETTMQFPAAGDYDVSIFLWEREAKAAIFAASSFATEASHVRYAALYKRKALR